MRVLGRGLAEVGIAAGSVLDEGQFDDPPPRHQPLHALALPLGPGERPTAAPLSRSQAWQLTRAHGPRPAAAGSGVLPTPPL